MLDSFNTDLLSLQERISNQQEVTVKLIHKELQNDKKQRELEKQNKPAIKQSIAERLESIENRHLEVIASQEQITEEVTKFQDSFEELMKRLE